MYGTPYSHHHDDWGGGVILALLYKGCSIAYLLSLQVVATSRNLSLQYVNSRICILIVGLGLSGAPMMHKIYGGILLGMCITGSSMCMGWAMMGWYCLGLDHLECLH